MEFSQFALTWNKVLHPEPLQDPSFLASLGKNYKLALLSNTDPVHMEYMEASYGFFSLFPVRVYSCAVGAAKPNPIIYREALRGCKVKAPEAIYIDDIPAYVEAARALGMKSIHYNSPEQLKLELGGYGVSA
jgi:putative hydrolase of the HAD superfamily